MHFDATFRIIKLKFETVACICQEQLYKFFMSKSPPIYVKMEIVTSIFLIILTQRAGERNLHWSTPL